MRYRKLDAFDDYSFGHSITNFYINQPEAVAQLVKTRLLLWLGEWYLNADDGTPYYQNILGKYSKATADQAIQNRVTSTDGVNDISFYSSTLDPVTRTLSVQMTLDTIYGPTTVQISNYATY